MKRVSYIGTSQFNIFNRGGRVEYNLTEPNELTWSDERICEHAFHIFNAPDELLNDWEKDIRSDARDEKLTYLSVGDTVTIENEEDGSITSYICENLGWKKKLTNHDK